MSETWEDIGPVVNQSLIPSRNLRPKPTISQGAGLSLGIINNLARRFPVPGGVSIEVHKDRIRALAEDCADIDPVVLKAAADQAARECTFLPSAAELRHFAKEETDRRNGVRSGTWLEDRMRRFNLEMIARGDKTRGIATKSGHVELFKVGSPGEKRRCDGRGGVVVPWFKDSTKQWIYPDGSTA